ncbi:MAG: TetR/AcrR family transcriptional regulator [Pyrinomonadaceae bacterium]
MRAIKKEAVLKGEKTRQEILKTSVDIASAEGLEGLSIGKLANEIGLSKSGLFAHFGSKEDLQIAAVQTAAEIFVAEIIKPTEDSENGLIKLYAMLDAWISYIERSIFRGGCFFFAVSAEMDDRPGKVRDLVAELTKSWVMKLESEAKLAVRLGELGNDRDVELLIFQVHGFVQEANWFYRLHEDKRAFEKARLSILQTLETFATESGKQILLEIKNTKK